MFKIKLEYWDEHEAIQALDIKKLLIEKKACHKDQIEIQRKK